MHDSTACSNKNTITDSSLRAAWQPYLHSVMHDGGDYYRCQAERNEAVLHVLHHSRENNQVSVECVEDRAVYIATLKREKQKAQWLPVCIDLLIATELFIQIKTINIILSVWYNHSMKPPKSSILIIRQCFLIVLKNVKWMCWMNWLIDKTIINQFKKY